jgi:hypothetical protein
VTVNQAGMKHTAYLANKVIDIPLGTRQTKAAFTAKPYAANVTTAMNTPVFTISTAFLATAKHFLNRFFILRSDISRMMLLE